MKEFFYTITESMLGLGIRGTELNLFAVIYGFSQRGGGCCYLKQDELAKWCGVSSRHTIISAISGLQEKGLINKFTIKKDGKDVVAYSVQNLHTGCAKIAQAGVQNFHERCAKIAHMNNKENITINDNSNSSGTKFVPPTQSQVAEYARQRGFKTPDYFAYYFIQHYTQQERPWHLSNGKPMKDWKQAVSRTWEPTSKDKIYSRPLQSAREATAEAFKHFAQL